MYFGFPNRANRCRHAIKCHILTPANIPFLVHKAAFNYKLSARYIYTVSFTLIATVMDDHIAAKHDLRNIFGLFDNKKNLIRSDMQYTAKFYCFWI